MTATIERVMRRADVATLLHREFGPLLAWTDFLRDCVKVGTTFHGLALLPCATIRACGQRPVYKVEDVELFIAELAAKVKPKPIEILTVQVPPAPAWMPARLRKATLITTTPTV